MEKKKNCTVRTVPKANQIIVERGKSGDYNWQVEFQQAMLLVQYDIDRYWPSYYYTYMYIKNLQLSRSLCFIGA